MSQPENSAYTSFLKDEHTESLVEIISRTRNKDFSAFEILYQHYKSVVWKNIVYLVGSKDVAHDLFQETFLRVWNKLPETNESLRFEPWLKRIAVNLAIDYLRHEKKIEFIQLSEEDVDLRFSQNNDPETLFNESNDISGVITMSENMLTPCREWAEILNKLHPEDLTPEERIALEEHLLTCSRCSTVLLQYQQLQSLLRNVTVQDTPTVLPSRLVQLRERYAKQKRWPLGLTRRATGPLQETANSTNKSDYYSHHSLRPYKKWLIASGSLAALLLIGVLLIRFIVLPVITRMGSTNTGANAAQFITPLPVFSEAIVYIANGNSVYAIQSQTGTHVRTYTVGNQDSRIQSLAPTVVNGVMYLPVGDFPASTAQSTYALYAVRLTDGSTLWHRPLSYTSLLPLVVLDGTLYVGDDNHILYALRATDGSLLWQHQGNSEDFYGVVKTGNTLFVESTANQIYALNASNGSTLWQHQFLAKNLSELVLHEGMLFVGADNILTVLRANNGTLVWSQHYQSQVGNLSIVRGVVYVSTADGFVHALQTSNGKQNWQQQVGSDISPISPLLYTNGMLYVSTKRVTNISIDQNSTIDGYIIALRASDGAIRWAYDIGERTIPSPAAGNGIIYVVSKFMVLYALQADTGQVRWQTRILS